MPSLACIIPVLESSEGLEATLVSVLEHRRDGDEVAVVLAAPYDDPYNLADEIQLLHAPPGASWLACVNLGIAATRAPLIHALASGSEVTAGWCDRAAAAFADDRVACASPAIYDATTREQPLASGLSYSRGGRRHVLCAQHLSTSTHELLGPRDAAIDAAHVGPLGQAAFYRRAALAAFGGGLPTATGDALADLDIALALRAAGWHARTLPDCRVYAPQLTAPQPGGLRGGLRSERLFWRHAASRGLVGSVVSHPFSVAGELFAGSPWNIPGQLLGRVWAMCQLGHYRQYQAQLAAAKVEAAAAHAAWETAQLTGSDGTHRRLDAAHELPRDARAEGATGKRSSWGLLVSEPEA